MDIEINKLNDKIDKLEKKVDKILELLHNINYSSSKMNEHIDFIENTYDTIRMPLNYVKKKIEYISGSSNTNDLPVLKQ